METKDLSLSKTPSTGQTAKVDASPPWTLPGRGEHSCLPVPSGHFACRAASNRVLTHCHSKYLHADVAQNPKCITSALIEM